MADRWAQTGHWPSPLRPSLASFIVAQATAPVRTHLTLTDRISNQTARRYTLGRRGLWPGRRWSGEAGTANPLETVECVQRDPFNAVARSHHLALLSRVHESRHDYLDNVMYRDRQLFDYGGNLWLFSMHGRLYRRMTIQGNARAPRWADYASPNASLMNTVRAELRARGPLGNRDLSNG